jgi:hypothetical protein
LKRCKLWDLNFGGMTMQIFKLYWKRWPKFENVLQKVPTPRTLQLLAFDEYPLLILLLSLGKYMKSEPRFISPKKAEVSKVDYSSKGKSCSVQYFACP